MSVAQQEVLVTETAASSGTNTEALSFFSLSRLGKIVTATGVASGISLPFLGHVSHEVYLRTWGIDAGLFPKSVDWTGVQGYFTLFDRIIDIFKGIAENWVAFVTLWLCLSGIVLYLYALNWISKGKNSGAVADWLSRNLPKWSRPPLMSLIIGGVIAVGITSALLITAMLLAVPAALGQSRGKAAAIAEITVFQQGCENAKMGNTCVELRKDGTQIAQGFLIDSSGTHIALFDVNQGRARVLERSGTELIAVPPKAP